MKDKNHTNILPSLSFKSKWLIFFILSILLMIPGLITIVKIFRYGLGVLPLNQGIFWGTLIINFIFWIGVAHAGTFISAILLLLRQNWREEIHRFAEAMTIIAVIIAALMPIFHLGKPIYFYKLLPITERTYHLLLNFSSPLVWDFYAIASYLIISLLFLYSGLLPDFARKRNQSLSGLQKSLWNYLSWGWTGSSLQWNNFRKFQWILALIAAPLVISVHSIVSLDFAVTLKPGWHHTVFPVYFVTGAIMSGFAMIACWVPFINQKYENQHFITEKHLDFMAKIILGCAIALTVLFLNEWLSVILSTKPTAFWLLSGQTNLILISSYLLTIILTLLLPQMLWLKKFRTNGKKLQLISFLILSGLWLERFVIVIANSSVSTLTLAKIPYRTTLPAISLILFSAGFFCMFTLLVIRYLPLKTTYSPETNA